MRITRSGMPGLPVPPRKLIIRLIPQTHTKPTSVAVRNDSPTVLICEQGDTWSAAWRRYDDGPHLPCVTTHTLEACQHRLQRAPASVAMVAFDIAPPSTLTSWLAAVTRRFPRACIILAGGSRLDPLRWQLLEYGASWIVSSQRTLPEACRLARRHLARWSPPTQDSITRIWQSLPWGNRIDDA